MNNDEIIENNNINPYYYSSMEIEPLDFIISNDLGFIEGNIIKYVSRYKLKNGLDDLKKARRYLDELIKLNS